MEARSAEEMPAGNGWQYEPKWDGFRCLAFRDDEEIYLQSKAGQPLARYFPDIVDALGKLPEQQFVLDGELVVPVGSALSVRCNPAIALALGLSDRWNQRAYPPRLPVRVPAPPPTLAGPSLQEGGTTVTDLPVHPGVDGAAGVDARSAKP